MGQDAGWKQPPSVLRCVTDGNSNPVLIIIPLSSRSPLSPSPCASHAPIESQISVFPSPRPMTNLLSRYRFNIPRSAASIGSVNPTELIVIERPVGLPIRNAVHSFCPFARASLSLILASSRFCITYTHPAAETDELRLREISRREIIRIDVGSRSRTGDKVHRVSRVRGSSIILTPSADNSHCHLDSVT